MIRSYDDYRIYLEADRISLEIEKNIRNCFLDEVWKFQRVLRKLEYMTNCRKNRISRLITLYRYRTLSLRLGFLIPIMIGTAFVVEKVFAFPGLARFGADAIIANDFNGVMGVTLVICTAFVLVNFIVDQLYAVVDPRIRLKR